jgi:hypothetical protein
MKRTEEEHESMNDDRRYPGQVSNLRPLGYKTSTKPFDREVST